MKFVDLLLEKTGDVLVHTARSFGTPLLKLLFRLKVTGKENIPSPPYIVASNHVSFIDPVFLGMAFPQPLHYMARWDFFIPKIVGTILWTFHAFPVRKGVGADPSAFEYAVDLLKKKRVVALFPEGTRSRTGTLGRFGHLVGALALASGAPIVPVYLDGLFEVMPPSGGFKLAPVEVRIGKPIAVGNRELGQGTFRKLSSSLAETVRKSIERLSSQTF